ncbi:MarR family winged helix-turn-helix transcriptional regulator [Sphingomonas koreensis]
MTEASGKREQGGAPQDDGSGQGKNLPGWKIEALDYPTFRLTLIAKIMDRLTIRLLAERGDISYAEWRAMARLATMPKGGTVGQIADLAWVDKAEVSRAVGSLEAKGLVARQPNAKDRRTPLLFLTPAGQARYETGIAERMRFHEGLLANFSEKERDQFDMLLERVGSQLVQMVGIPSVATE